MCFTDLIYQVKETQVIPNLDPEKVTAGVWGVIKRSVFNGGPSSTRVVYVSVGLTCTLVLALATMGYTATYIIYKVADGAFGAFLTAAWTALFGFASATQKGKNAQAALASPAASAASPELPPDQPEDK